MLFNRVFAAEYYTLPIPEDVDQKNGLIINITIPAKKIEFKSKKKKVKKEEKPKKIRVIGKEFFLSDFKQVDDKNLKNDLLYFAKKMHEDIIDIFGKIPISEYFDKLYSITEKIFNVDEDKRSKLLTYKDCEKLYLLIKKGIEKYGKYYPYFLDKLKAYLPLIRKEAIKLKRASGKVRIVKIKTGKSPAGDKTIQIILETIQ